MTSELIEKRGTILIEPTVTTMSNGLPLLPRSSPCYHIKYASYPNIPSSDYPIPSITTSYIQSTEYILVNSFCLRSTRYVLKWGHWIPRDRVLVWSPCYYIWLLWGWFDNALILSAYVWLYTCISYPRVCPLIGKTRLSPCGDNHTCMYLCPSRLFHHPLSCSWERRRLNVGLLDVLCLCWAGYKIQDTGLCGECRQVFRRGH